MVTHEGSWDKDHLEQALQSPGLPALERWTLHLRLCRRYMEDPADYLKAREHGEQALAGAEAGGLPGVAAPALYCLGACYVHLRRFADAIQLLKRYLQLLPALGAGEAALEGEVLLQLGVAYAQRGDHCPARAALGRAQAWFGARGQADRAEACRRHLASLCLKKRDYTAVAELLRTGEEYLAVHPHDQTARWALYLERGEYELATGNLLQAVKAANAALAAAGSDAVQCYQCYMLMLRCARGQGHHKEALNFALSARVMALDAHRYDLDFQATVVFIELFRSMGDAARPLLRQLDHEYQQRGLDIYRYLPETLLLRRGDGGNGEGGNGEGGNGEGGNGEGGGLRN